MLSIIQVVPENVLNLNNFRDIWRRRTVQILLSSSNVCLFSKVPVLNDESLAKKILSRDQIERQASVKFVIP